MKNTSVECPKCKGNSVVKALNPLAKDHNEHWHCFECDYRWRSDPE